MLTNDLKISSLKECEKYKYLGILETEDINAKENERKSQS